MRITSQAIDHPRFVLVATLLVLLIAGYALLYTPVQRSPAINKAVVLVAIPYPDSSPQESEIDIAKKVEDALGELQGVDFISSTNMRGSSVTQVIFLDGVDPDDGRREVKDLVDRIRNELPAGREIQPIVTDIDFESAPIMLVTLTGPPGFDDRSLKRIAEDVQDQLETVDGVANTQLFGGREREIHVNINPDRLTQYGLTIADVRDAVAQFHAKIPAGSLNTGRFDRQVRNEAKLRGVQDIRQAIVSSRDGQVIRVDDVANVMDSNRRLMNLAQLDGRDGATIIVNKEADINTLGAAVAVREKVDSLQQQFPDIKFSVTRDTSEEIWLMFRVLGSSAAFGAMLVLVILAWSMGLRISMLVLIAIPFSSAVAIAFLFFAGIPISNMVVFSYILVLGLVVDGAIIVAENIHRHIERGEDPITAAKVGIEEVGLPVIAADLTTVAAFLPMLMVPGIMGDFMGVMPKVVSVALLGSVLVDHFLIPTLAARWYRRREVPSEEPQLPQGGAAMPAVGGRIRPNLGPFARGYARMLQYALNHRWLVLSWCGLAVWGAVVLCFELGFTFFPSSDRGQFTIKYELPLGYSIEQTLAAAEVLTGPLEEFREEGYLVNYVTAVGSSSALASRIENDPASGPEFGEVMVQLLSPLDRKIHEDEILDALRQRIRPLPGMKVTFHKVEEGPPGGFDVAVRLTGDNLEQMGVLAKQISSRMAQVSGTVDAATDYRDQSPELVVEPKPEVLGQFDLRDMQVARAVQTAIAGDTRVEIYLDDEDINVRIQLAPEYQRHVEDLKRLMITSPSGRKATVGQLADIRREVGLYSVNRYERNRAVVARCDVKKPTQSADVFKVLADEILPELGFVASAGAERTIEGIPKAFLGTETTVSEGIKAEFTGENEERDKNFGYLLSSMIIGVVLIFAILVMQFNSIRQSILVMVTVPLSFVGVVLGMWACNFPFSLASFIGLVSLTGIVVNDAIVMVDFTNQARRRGLAIREALIEAGVNRLRPVVLTTVTTIGGLLPLFLNISGGAEFWQPLTGAVVFGLGFSSVLTLVVIPVIYSLAYETGVVRAVAQVRRWRPRLRRVAASTE